MTQIYHIEDMPSPVAVLCKIEESGARFAARHPDETMAEAETYFPIVVECRNIQELDRLTAHDPDVEKQLLIDKERDRIYVVAIGWPGRIKVEGSGEEDARTIDVILREQTRSIVYYTEVTTTPTQIKTS